MNRVQKPIEHLEAHGHLDDALHELTNALSAAHAFAEVLEIRKQLGTLAQGEAVDPLLRELDRVGEIAWRVRRDARREYEEFLTWVFHEISEPIRRAETLLSGISDRASALPQDDREALYHSLNNILDVKNNLAALREFQEASVLTEMEPVDVHALLLDLVSTAPMSRLIEERRADCRVEGRLPESAGTPALVRHVLRELITNAIQHNQSSHPEVQLGGRILENGRREYWVKDNGPGIPRASRERVFRLYATGPTGSKGTPSVGVGLSIARRAVESMGGSIAITDAPQGTGTVVQFRLQAPPGERLGRNGPAEKSLPR